MIQQVGEKQNYICSIIRLRKYVFAVLLFCTAMSSRAAEISDLLGKTINDREIQHLITAMEPYTETFLPYAKAYKITSLSSGIELEFNSYFVLFKMSLYDSGYRYKAFQGKLPFDLSWGWDSTQVQDVTDYLIYNDKNPYVKSFKSEQHTIDFYFRDNQMEVIRLEADTSLIVEGTGNALKKDFGYRLYPNGKKVSGNTLDGKGVMEWSNGAYRYEGEWSYGVPHGKGMYTDSFGNSFIGEFKLGFFWGEGIFKSSIGVYEGDFVLGKYQGTGTFKYSNGTSYTGGFYKGSMDGWGTYRFSKEYYYVGQMSNDAFNGEGILYTKDGWIKGNFKNGKPHGYCEQFAVQSAQTLKGTWVNGKKEGEFIKTTFGYDQKVMFKDDIEQFPEEKVEE